MLWIAAGLTLYTGYVYLKAGLVHARAEPKEPRTGAAPIRRHQNAV